MQALNKSATFGRTAELKARSPASAAVRCAVVVRAEQIEVRLPSHASANTGFGDRAMRRASACRGCTSWTHYIVYRPRGQYGCLAGHRSMASDRVTGVSPRGPRHARRWSRAAHADRPLRGSLRRVRQHLRQGDQHRRCGPSGRCYARCWDVLCACSAKTLMHCNRGSVLTLAAGFVPYAGEGYALLLPSKWNPSKERDFPGVELR